MGFLFILSQYEEFSRLPFNIKDSVYGNIFYSITGLHLLHVSLGLIVLIIFYIMLILKKRNF
jgi:cytochrome c oxidase subunit I+III